MVMKILAPEEIKQPSGSLIHKGPEEGDWNHGEPTMGAAPTVLCPDKNWILFIVEYEFQQNNLFDQFDCVTQSAWNKVQCLAKKLFGITLNKSKRYTAKKSGTIPHQGNSVTNVVESIRKSGGVEDSVYPTLVPNMTEAEFYQDIPASIDAQESFLKDGWVYNHAWLPISIGATIESIVDNGLFYSPVMVSIEGNYHFDDQGRLQFANTGYTHEVLIVASQPDRFLALDSENPSGLLSIRRDYNFSWPKIGYLQKKTLFQLVKEDSSPAVYLHCTISGNLYAIADSEEVPGGDLLKTFSGDYKNAGIKHVAHLSDLGAVYRVGEIKAIKF